MAKENVSELEDRKIKCKKRRKTIEKSIKGSSCTTAN